MNLYTISKNLAYAANTIREIIYEKKKEKGVQTLPCGTPLGIGQNFGQEFVYFFCPFILFYLFNFFLLYLVFIFVLLSVILF